MSPLDPQDIERCGALARELAEHAGALLMERFQSALHVQYKDDHGHDPVTEVDHAVETLIRSEILGHFPGHAVLGEEQADTGPPRAEIVWVVDPLDGTSNFINGLPLFACSIGVLERGAPMAGAVFVPVSRRLRPGVFHAHRGGGLHFEGEPVAMERAPVAAANRLSGLPAGVGGITGPRGRRFGIARTLGSVAAELTLAAEGTLQIAVFDGARIWDVAGGAALCLEAGVTVCQRPRGGAWRPLGSFADGMDGGAAVGPLRRWDALLSAGDPMLVPSAVDDLRREQGVRRTIWRALHRRH